MMSARKLVFFIAAVSGLTTSYPMNFAQVAEVNTVSVSPRDEDALTDWRRRVIYFTVVDRFSNGNPGNDTLNGVETCNQANDIHAYQGGDIDGLTQRLDYISNLGADALWITPLYKGVAEKAGANCGFPGYWADFKIPYQLELDPRFGTALEFDHLLNQSHSQGMKVMLDMVVNHAGYGATIFHQRPEWFTEPSSCSSQGDPEIFCSLAGLPDFDHRRKDVRDYLVDLHQRWIDRFDIDGIRMDTVKHVDPLYFKNQWIPGMIARDNSLYVIGELLDEGSFYKYDRYLEAGFDGLFNFPLRRAFIDTFARGGSVDAVAARMSETITRYGEERASYMINLLDNHDVPRFLEEMSQGISLEEKQERYLLALTALLTVPGVPQIYYGNEIGMFGGRDPYNRRFMPEWAFSEQGRLGTYEGFLPEPNKIFTLVKDLLRIRQNYTPLQIGSYREVWRQNGPQNSNVWAFERSHNDENAVVVFNNGFLPPSFPVTLSLSNNANDGEVYVDILGRSNQKEIKAMNGSLTVTLPGRSAAVFVPKKLVPAIFQSN
ncbi:MAG: alpha-glucosidase C-terminal domain-containing protein [Pseudobacteriovorax sp.]|nr:alpha-glucosidase C-terminal domain-containing protein [Pseudobacteriovorax sp.]